MFNGAFKETKSIVQLSLQQRNKSGPSQLCHLHMTLITSCWTFKKLCQASYLHYQPEKKWNTVLRWFCCVARGMVGSHSLSSWAAEVHLVPITVINSSIEDLRRRHHILCFCVCPAISSFLQLLSFHVLIVHQQDLIHLLQAPCLYCLSCLKT